MFDVINQILHLPPEIAIVVLGIFAWSTYADFRQDWKFNTLLILLSTVKPDPKTKTIPYQTFADYGLTKNQLIQ